MAVADLLPLSSSNTFKLGQGQTIRIGGFFNYEHQDTDYGSTPDARALGFTSVASASKNIYTGGGFLRYDFGKSYLGALANGDWGDGDFTDKVAGAKGDFDSEGYLAAFAAGHAFALGEKTGLEVIGWVGAYEDRIDGFKQSDGFVWGDEVYRYGLVGGEAKLSVALGGGNLTWIPFVSGIVSQDFGRTHKINIPAQDALPAEVLHFQDAETFWGGRFGVDVVSASGWRFGANGWAGATDDLDDVGGRAYVVFPLGGWHSASAAPPPEPIK